MLKQNFIENKHSNSVALINEDLEDFDAELRNDIFILESLEKLLVVVQEQIEFLKADNPKKDMKAYRRIKERLDNEYEKLKNILDDMSDKAKKIITENENIETKRTPRYEPLSFVKKDSEN